jgi:uncharacterized protein YndB with AHSA1/START domain
MPHPTTTFGSFTIDRTYPVSPREVFEAWASRDAKDRWFGSGQDFLETTDEYSLDFRVGGVERLTGKASRDRAFQYEAVHQDIVENERIVMTYDVLVGGRRLSVSLMTAEITPVDGGANLSITEQGVFLDGLDDNEERKLGGLSNLDSLERYLAQRVPAATA